MTDVPLGVPTTCSGGPPHPCDEGDCEFCLCHIAGCEICWTESDQDLRTGARVTWELVRRNGGVIGRDGMGREINLGNVLEESVDEDHP